MSPDPIKHSEWDLGMRLAFCTLLRYYTCVHAFQLAPTVTVNTSPTLSTGISGEDSVELLCTVAVMENIVEVSYLITWMKNGNSLDLSDNRIQVCIILLYL